MCIAAKRQRKGKASADEAPKLRRLVGIARSSRGSHRKDFTEAQRRETNSLRPNPIAVSKTDPIPEEADGLKY